MDNGKISVVLTVYNGKKYVGKAIQSVINQTYYNWELIVVNDCSTDRTLDVIRDFANNDSRIIIINNETNQKLPRSLNVGFSAASGEYYTWTSDDNLFHEDAFEKMVNILNKNEKIGLVYADFTIVDMEGRIIEEIKEAEPSEIKYGDNVGACFLYRKTVAEKVGEYDPETFLAEDYDFFIRCYQRTQFYHLKEDLYDYGRHEKNLSATRQQEIHKQAFLVMNKYFDFFYSECYTQDEKNRLFNEMLKLIDDPYENKKERKRFYKKDKKFAKQDKLIIMKNLVKRYLRIRS